jgi:hypothetical protein
MMAKLKLGAIEDDKPVRLTLDLPAALHRDLIAYGQILGGGTPIEPVKLIGPMLERFMATDRGFASARRPPKA